MTREKKEIIKRINEIETFIAVDEQLGCGFAPADFYDELYEEIDRLEDKLAQLQGFKNAEDKYCWQSEFLSARKTMPFEF